jgi:alanyl-tRNA synthetase
MTERLYYSDSYCTTFGARVIAHLRLDGAPAVVLDRTAFYPTGGGQPHDVGVLRLPHPRKDTISVLDVFVREEDQAIVHVLADSGAARQLSEGDLIQGEIDWDRRFDLMQQHTGQHILSQAFVRVAGADTVGFHLSDEYSTVDLSHDSLRDDHLARVETLANQIVFENRPMLAQFVPPGDVDKLP